MLRLLLRAAHGKSVEGDEDEEKDEGMEEVALGADAPRTKCRARRVPAPLQHGPRRGGRVGMPAEPGPARPQGPLRARPGRVRRGPPIERSGGRGGPGGG
ncbi:hypothetical protein THAOC_11168, partial [Thalassiosira oceanica]